MKNVSAEKINVNEYIKSKLKAFLETFATLGDIIGGAPSASKLTGAELEAAQIWKNNPESAKAIERFEARETIPEKESTTGKTKEAKKRKSYGVKAQVQTKEADRELTNSKVNKDKSKGYEIGE